MIQCIITSDGQLGPIQSPPLSELILSVCGRSTTLLIGDSQVRSKPGPTPEFGPIKCSYCVLVNSLWSRPWLDQTQPETPAYYFGRDVRFGSKADKPFQAKVDRCRLCSKSGQTRVRLECPLSANSGRRFAGRKPDELTANQAQNDPAKSGSDIH